MPNSSLSTPPQKKKKRAKGSTYEVVQLWNLKKDIFSQNRLCKLFNLNFPVDHSIVAQQCRAVKHDIVPLVFVCLIDQSTSTETMVVLEEVLEEPPKWKVLLVSE